MIRSLKVEYIRDVMTWVVGRLDRVRPYQLIGGGVSLKENAIARYRELIASGFVPTEVEIAITLGVLQVPPEMHDVVKRMLYASDEQLCDFIDQRTFVCDSCGERALLSEAVQFIDGEEPICPKCYARETAE